MDNSSTRGDKLIPQKRERTPSPDRLKDTRQAAERERAMHEHSLELERQARQAEQAKQRAFDRYWDYVRPQIFQEVTAKMEHLSIREDHIGNFPVNRVYEANQDMKKIESEYPDVVGNIRERARQYEEELRQRTSMGAWVDDIIRWRQQPQ